MDYISTDFDVNSSSHFPFRARTDNTDTHTHRDKIANDHPIHISATANVCNNSNIIILSCHNVVTSQTVNSSIQSPQVYGIGYWWVFKITQNISKNPRNGKISKIWEMVKFSIFQHNTHLHGILVECVLLFDDDTDEAWSTLYTLSHNLRISASLSFHSGIILIAASSFGSFVFGLLHWYSTKHTPQPQHWLTESRQAYSKNAYVTTISSTTTATAPT